MNYTINEPTNQKLLNNTYILGNNINKSNNIYYAYKGFDNEDEVNKELLKKRALVEFIREDTPVKPYIDYDDCDKVRNLIKNEKTLLFLNTDIKQEVLKRLINIFVNGLNMLGCNLTSKNVLITDSSRIVLLDNKRYFKFSFHITTTNNKFVFKNTVQCKNFLLPILKRSSNELYNNLAIFNNIDSKVYGKTQRLRTIYSYKSSNDRDIMTPINEKGEELTIQNPVKYFVQYFKDDFIYINLPDFHENTPKSQRSSSRGQFEALTKNKNINDYSYDIQKLLIKKGMTTATIQKITNNKNFTTYHILYNPNVHKCPYGEEHDRVIRGVCVCYSYIFNGCGFVGCWGSNCNKKENINIGSILEKSPLDNINNALQVKERYLTETKNNKVNETMNKFINDESLKVVCIKSGTGTGKTYLLNEYINNQSLRILVISTRQSYARSMCGQSLKSLNIINYLDFKDDEKTDNNDLYKLPRLCISMEGLNGLMLERWKPYDIVIIDESESVCRHLFSPTIKSGAYATFNRLRELINYSKKTFLLDADLSTPSLTLINNIDEKQIIKINNTYEREPKKYYFSKDKKNFIDDIKSKLILNNKLYIVCLSKTEAINLMDELKNITDTFNKSVHLIHGDSGEATKQELKRVNEIWINYDLVITTSTTGAGVDFNVKNHFNYVYGFITAGCSPPVEFTQIIDRVRHPTNNNINVLIDSKINIPSENTFINTYENSKYIIDELNKNTKLSDIVNYSFIDEEGFINNEKIYKTKSNDFSKLTYYNYLTTTLNNNNNNYLLVLKLVLEQKGHKVIIDDEKYKQERVKNINAEQLKIIKVVDYKEDDIKDIYFNKLKSSQEKQIMKKINICNTFKIDKSKRDDEKVNNIIDVYTSPTKKDIINLVLRTHIKDEHAINLIETLKENDDESDKVRQNKMNLYRRLLSLIKYDYTKDFKISIEEMNNIINNFNVSDVERRSITRSKLDDYKIIQTVFNKYGLIINKEWTVNKIDGKSKKTIKGYMVKPSKDVYNCISLIVNNNEYDNNINKLCNEYNDYRELKQGEKKEIKKLF